MKTAETKTTTAAQHLQTKGEAQQPFFQKEGGDSVWSNGKPSFFNVGSQPPLPADPPFFNKSGIRPKIQAKLTVGQPGDKYEQEADSMADQVVQKLAVGSSSEQFTQTPQPLISQYPNIPISKIQRKPIFESDVAPNLQTKLTPNFQTSKLPNPVQRKCAECEQEEKLQQKEELVSEEDLQMKPIFEGNAEPPEENTIQRKCSVCGKEESIQKKDNDPTPPSGGLGGLESTLSATKGSGSPLPADTRSSMEGAFGADFSGVRVHTNSTAVQMNQDLGAQAFTHGSDIYFNAGKYSHGNTDGQRLLAHELTHTVQQNNNIRTNKIQRQIDVISNLPTGMYVDRYENFIYDLDYRPQRRGDLSKYITITYLDGNVIDINIDSISDGGNPADTVEHMRNGYLGDAGRIFPRQMNRFTTPRLYAAKREVINIMEEYNFQFMLGTLPAILFIITMPVGLGAGTRPIRTPITRRPVGLLVTTGRFSVDAGRVLTTEEWIIARQLIREGRTVRALAESTSQGVRSADFLVDGIRTELKNISNISSRDISGALSRRIRDGAGQGNHIIIDARGQQGLTRADAERAIRRFFGAETQGRVRQVRIIGGGFDITIPRI
jgi:hypothetical protein